MNADVRLEKLARMLAETEAKFARQLEQQKKLPLNGDQTVFISNSFASKQPEQIPKEKK